MLAFGLAIWKGPFSAGRNALKKSALAGVAVVAVFGTAVSRFKSRTKEEELAQRRQLALAASAELQQASADWKRVVQEIETVEARERQAIAEARRKYADLQRAFDAARQTLLSDPAATQRRAFLRMHAIASGVKRLSPARQAALRAYGYETAADVVDGDIEADVPGIGPKRANELRHWAKSLEARFRFDRGAGAADSEVRLLVQRFEQRRAALRRAIESSLAALRNLRTTARPALTQAGGELKRRTRAHAQASADLKVAQA